MADNIDRSWHPNFKEYTEKIVQHPNYKGLFYERTPDGNVQWVVTGKSDKGQKRLAWWNEQCIKHNIPIQKGCYAIISRLIHPTKKKVCQCCGKELSILYEYPDKSLLRKINDYFNCDLEQTQYTIKEIITNYCNKEQDLLFFIKVLGINKPLLFRTKTFEALRQDLIDIVYTDFVEKCSKPFSPGAMSNCPDRFDGYHSDGLCCRERTDKGRHSENMMTYTQDRRAYEEWADGNFNLANRIMGEFRKDERLHRCPQCGEWKKMSADHIGPISLGFCHSKYFAPLCDSCNSSKNNRFTKRDVEELLALESKGEQVISWHAKYIWDALKHEVKNDADAKKMSSIMVQCHQNVLKLFSLIYKKTGREFLQRFLHPEYAYVDYRFEDFDPFNLSKLKIISKPLTSANKESNANRYLRVAFESLEEFDAKQNRKTQFVVDLFSNETRDLITTINTKNYASATTKLKSLIERISMFIKKTTWD